MLMLLLSFLQITSFPITPFPTSPPVPVSAPTCTGSTPGWVDVDGDGCEWYEQNDPLGCPYSGDWAGYDENTGEVLVGEAGSVANANCCHCFGTAVSKVFQNVINALTVVKSAC